jgi:hydroxyethylthiazole kinase-like uncharacterized protein yjeF
MPETVVITPAVLRDWELPVPSGGKESRGHLLVVAGTTATPGAARLTAEAALRAGVGKLTMAVPATTAVALGVAIPEAMVVPLDTGQDGHPAGTCTDRLASLAQGVDAVVIGPGFSDPGPTVELLAGLAPRLDTALVVDATASAYIGRHPRGLAHLAGRLVLTVNPSELAQTAGRPLSDVDDDPAGVASELAGTSGAVVVLGGSDKHVLAPGGDHWLYQGGGPGLGISGSGDVHAGIVAGLVGRGAEPAQAGVWAAYVHGRTGERLATDIGPLGALAREQLDHIPRVLAEVG